MSSWRTALAFWCCGSVACSKADPPKPEARPEPPRLEVGDTSFRYPAVERIVAIGDIHGDLQAARTALKLAGAIDDGGNWVGGRLVVVQTGDQLDRGDDEPEIIDLFERLRAAAKSAGGAFHALNGNHEIMNVQGDFRYVTPDGFRDWSGERGRATAFLPGGAIAKRLSAQPVVIQVGGNVFVHGGVLEPHVKYGLARINSEVAQWMNGDIKGRAPASVIGDDAPIWSRDYSEPVPIAKKCEELGRVLSALGAKRMVVGHTVQERGINSACDGRVWRIDVGLSRRYGGKPSVLELRGDNVRAIAG